MYLNIIKAIYDKFIANIILNGEKLKLSPLKSEMRKRCPLFFNVVLEFQARQEEVKGIKIKKEEVKPSLLADHRIL
jgi:hypothetical protein